MTHTTSPERTFLVGKLTVTLRTSTRRTTDLSVTPDGCILVRAPRGTSNNEAAALVRGLRSWIYLQLHRVQRSAPVRPTKRLLAGESFTIFGVPHRLRRVDKGEQEQSIAQHRNTESGPRLHVHPSLADHPEQAREALIRWYAEQAQEWLDQHGEEFACYRDEPDLTLRASVRLSTALAIHRPRQELVLSWTAAQHSRTSLHTLMADTFGLAAAGDLRALREAYRRLWLGDLRRPSPAS